MNHSQLRAFHAAAEHLSFTRAARALRVSQPTLSGHVATLEQSYGVKLFQRIGRRVEITEFGQALLDITRQYFASELDAQRLLSTAKGLVRGRLSVTADSPFYIMPVLAAFSARYPLVRRSISFGNSEEVLRDVLSGESDIGLLPEVAEDQRLHTMPFYRDRLVVVVSQGHPWAQRQSVRLKDVASQTVLLREEGSTTRALVDRALAKTRIVPGDVLVVGSREAIREAVAVGLGIGIVSEGEFGNDQRLRKLAVSDRRLEVVEYLVCRASHRANPAVAAFLALAGEMSPA